MPVSAFDKLLALPVISDAALDKALATITKDEMLSPAELTEIEKLATLPDSRFEKPVDGGVWFGRTQELESLLGAAPLVRAAFAVTSPVPGISLSFSPNTRIENEDAGGGFVRVYSRDLSINVAAATQPKDATLAFTYGGYKVSVAIKKGDTRDAVMAKLQTRLLRQQGSFSRTELGGSKEVFSLHAVRTFAEGKNQKAARIAKEDERWLRTTLGSVVDPADYRKRTVGEVAGSLAADVTALLASSSMSAKGMRAVRERAEKGGLTLSEVDQLLRVAVQPRARVSPGALDELSTLRAYAQLYRPVLNAPFTLSKTFAGANVSLSKNMNEEKELGMDEFGPTSGFARKLVIELSDAALKSGGTLEFTVGTRTVTAHLKAGLTRKAAMEALADVAMNVCESCHYGSGKLEGFVTYAH